MCLTAHVLSKSDLAGDDSAVVDTVGSDKFDKEGSPTVLLLEHIL